MTRCCDWFISFLYFILFTEVSFSGTAGDTAQNVRSVNRGCRFRSNFFLFFFFFFFFCFFLVSTGRGQESNGSCVRRRLGFVSLSSGAQHNSLQHTSNTNENYLSEINRKNRDARRATTRAIEKAKHSTDGRFNRMQIRFDIFFPRLRKTMEPIRII